MSAEIVNMHRARKAKTKEKAQATAAENRVKHGRSKAERTKSELQARQAHRLLDAHRRSTPEDET
jgi:hypothetical protein